MLSCWTLVIPCIQCVSVSESTRWVMITWQNKSSEFDSFKHFQNDPSPVSYALATWLNLCHVASTKISVVPPTVPCGTSTCRDVIIQPSASGGRQLRSAPRGLLWGSQLLAANPNLLHVHSERCWQRSSQPRSWLWSRDDSVYAKLQCL